MSETGETESKRQAKRPLVGPKTTQFGLALVLVFGVPYFAPIFAEIGGKSFGKGDWTLLSAMFTFSIAASTRSPLLALLALVAGAVEAGIFIYQPRDGALDGWRLALVTVVPFLLAAMHFLERIRIHYELGEKVWH